MKKVILSLAVLFSVAMVSCGDKKAEATDTAADTTVQIEETTDTTVVAEEAPAADSTVAAPAVDSAAAQN